MFHRTDRPIQPGTQVLVKAREDLRRDHSAQHSGEHVLSGLAYTLFGAKNVGFHMAADYVTLDLDIFLDEEKLRALELAANQAVQRKDVYKRQMQNGAIVAVPLAEAASKTKFLPTDHPLIRAARDVGTGFGD